LSPLAIFPAEVGYGLLFLGSLVAFTYTAYRLGAKPLSVTALLLSPPVMHSLLNGNIDAISVFGFILPPRVGLFFVIIKPQIGSAVAIYWLFEAWRKGRIGEVVRVFAPITLTLLLSFLLFGFWPGQFGVEIELWWNASLWPASIPVGLALLVAAIRRGRMEYAMAASPCLSPYVLLHAWVGALMALAGHAHEMVAAVLGLWVMVGIQAF
jgi:hypothetical protein